MTRYAHSDALAKRKSYMYKLVATINTELTNGLGRQSAICLRPVEGQEAPEWFKFLDLEVEKVRPSFALQRRAVCFIFELEADEPYDTAQENENLKKWHENQRLKNITAQEKAQKLYEIQLAALKSKQNEVIKARMMLVDANLTDQERKQA